MNFCFCEIKVKTGKLYTSYRGISSMYTLDSGHMLLTIAQSTPHIFLLQFSKRNRELLCTFVFKKLA